MTVDQFLKKYGTETASRIIRLAVEISEKEKFKKVALVLADDLEDALADYSKTMYDQYKE